MAYQAQMELFPGEAKVEQDCTATFADNMKLPIHKWYRYTAGFSAAWVKELIREEKENGRTRIIDPCAGSGTVLLESEFEGVESYGLEVHPYIYRIATAKLNWNYPADKFREEALSLLKATTQRKITQTEFLNLLLHCYPPDLADVFYSQRRVTNRFHGKHVQERKCHGLMQTTITTTNMIWILCLSVVEQRVKLAFLLHLLNLLGDDTPNIHEIKHKKFKAPFCLW